MIFFQPFPKQYFGWMLTLPFVPTVKCWSIPGFGSWGRKTEGRL